MVERLLDQLIVRDSHRVVEEDLVAEDGSKLGPESGEAATEAEADEGLEAAEDGELERARRSRRSRRRQPGGVPRRAERKEKFAKKVSPAKTLAVVWAKEGICTRKKRKGAGTSILGRRIVRHHLICSELKTSDNP